MSGQWISRWINFIIQQNLSSKYAKNLRSAFNRKDVMLAVVVNLNMRNKNGELRLAFQKYEPKDGANMKPWGTEWTG